MSKYLAVVVFMALLGLFFGCTRKPEVVSMDQLSFPVIRILETVEGPRHSDQDAGPPSQFIGHARVFLDQESLSRIPVQELWNVAGPLVVDSNANVLEIKDIKNERGGFWAMINPSGQMPVRFTLIKHKETGIEAARATIAKCQFLGRDLDEERTDLRRERIRNATSGKEIIQIICEAIPTSSRKK